MIKGKRWLIDCFYKSAGLYKFEFLGSLTDAVFELEKEVTQEEVNHVFKEASEGTLKGILGYEDKPLVSIDYVNGSSNIKH